jgi:hypothetical protein
VLGTLKLRLGRGLAALEKLALPPAPLPVEVLASRVVLVGASVSDHWNVEVRYPCVAVRKVYSFDKSAEIDRLLDEPPLPDAIIVKECAAYFPLALEPATAQVRSWIDRIRAADVVPILATVVPVTRRHASRQPGRLEGILAYNDWIRSFGAEASIPVLELERALRRSDDDRHLDERWATRDGLHLRRVAYRRRLDPILQPVLVAALS